MKALLLVLMAAASPSALAARAQGGVGALLGEPVAGTVMVRWDEKQAVQGLMGWSFGQQRMHVGADYLYTATEIDLDDHMGLRYLVYVGIGLRLRLMGEDTTAGQERGMSGFDFPSVCR